MVFLQAEQAQSTRPDVHCEGQFCCSHMGACCRKLHAWTKCCRQHKSHTLSKTALVYTLLKSLFRDSFISSHWQQPFQLTKVACHSLDVGVVPVWAVHRRVAVRIDEQLTAVPAEHAPIAVRGGAGFMGCCDTPGSCILWRTTRLDCWRLAASGGVPTALQFSQSHMSWAWKVMRASGMSRAHSVTQAKAKMQRAPPGQPA